MEVAAEIKDEISSEFDAFSDGTTVHRRYKLRDVKPKIVLQDTIKETNKNSIESEDTKTYDCSQCTKYFYSKTGLLNHMRMHEVDRKFTCALCQSVFDTNEQLIKHKIIHKNEDRVFICNICQVAFTDHCDFMVHDIDHVKKKTYKCAECTVYYEPSYIKLHIQTHFDRSVKCNVCGKTYQGELRLQYHMKTHDASNHIECGECGRVFKEKANYNYHMISHTGVKPFQCLYCGIGFSTSNQRKVHTIRKHTDERPFECKICHDKFKMASDVKSHMSIHETVKKLECDVCGKKFFHKQSLQFHRRSHTKEMYECPECDRTFTTRLGVRCHMVYIHMDNKDFKCDLCDMSFKTIGAIRRHNKSKTHQRSEYRSKAKE